MSFSAISVENLCATYWYPLYAYVRRRGHSFEDARDLTQEFFECIIEKHYLRSVDRNRGKFRSFLLGAMNHFLANERDRQRAKKRGGGHQFVSMNAQEAEGKYRSEPEHEETPETVFGRRWALTILDEALKRLREDFWKKGKQDEFEVLKELLELKRVSGNHEKAAERLGITPGNLSVKVYRLRRRYRELVEQEIAQTVSHPDELEEERQHLFACLAS